MWLYLTFPWLAVSQADRFTLAQVAAPFYFGAAVALVKLFADCLTCGVIEWSRMRGRKAA